MVGFAGSGKDTVANIISSEYDYDRTSFAKALKDVLSAMFGWDRDLIEGSSKESRSWREKPDVWWHKHLNWDTHPLNVTGDFFTPRKAMQLIGTNLLRAEFCDALWVLRVQHYIQNSQSNIIVTDCRFPNEISMIKNHGGKIIRVKRGPEPEWVNIARDALDQQSPTQSHSLEEMKKLGIHQSEWAWLNDEPDFVIENNGTLEDLVNKITTVMNLLNHG